MAVKSHCTEYTAINTAIMVSLPLLPLCSLSLLHLSQNVLFQRPCACKTVGKECILLLHGFLKVTAQNILPLILPSWYLYHCCRYVHCPCYISHKMCFSRGHAHVRQLVKNVFYYCMDFFFAVQSQTNIMPEFLIISNS